MSTSPAAQSASSRNRAYFSSPSQIYLREKPFFDAYAAKWTNEFLQYESWLDLPSSDSGKKLRMLDYACGNGMASFAALKFANAKLASVVGVDVADGMVGLFNQRVKDESGIIPDGLSIEAYRGDLTSEDIDCIPAADTTRPTQQDPLVPEADLSKPDFKDFDFVTVVASLHHFDDPVLAVRRFVERLVPGGVLFVSDMVPGPAEGAEDVWEGTAQPKEGGIGHHHHHGHAHGHGYQHGHGHSHGHDNHTGKKEDTGVVSHGFTKSRVEEIFTQAGLVDVKTRLMDNHISMPESFNGSTMKVFWIVGRKQA